LTLVPPELLRQPDKYMKYGFIHQPWDLLWEPIASDERGRQSRRRHGKKSSSAQI
jgi:hypothetical protein